MENEWCWVRHDADLGEKMLILSLYGYSGQGDSRMPLLARLFVRCRLKRAVFEQPDWARTYVKRAKDWAAGANAVSACEPWFNFREPRGLRAMSGLVYPMG
jgi:hypothetical protein